MSSPKRMRANPIGCEGINDVSFRFGSVFAGWFNVLTMLFNLWLAKEQWAEQVEKEKK